MRAFDKVYIITVILIIILFAGFNIAMADYNISQGSRQYRVEIKRAALEIEEKGYNGIDISKYKYITNIQKYNNNGSFYNVNSDYYICVINGLLYRFDYIADGSGNTGIIIQADIIIIIMAAVVVAVFTFVRQKILLPFEELSELPYELSKGNLVIPLKENKNRYFVKFLWGLDLLRENTMEQKQRELKLQKDKNTLLLSISHDIKTPLSAIKLYSKAFLTNLYKDSAKQREIAEKINKKTDEIEKFVSQIAKASGEEYLSLDVNADEIFLSSVINKIAGYYNEKLGLVNIKFDIGEYTDCLIYGDTGRAAEVVQNIIENAIKYGDGDIISIDITEEDGCILVAVRNSGNNLPETELPHIFDSFWRGSNAESNKGSGLGLYICRQLMHKMNGEIFAEIKGKDMVVTVVFQKI